MKIRTFVFAATGLLLGACQPDAATAPPSAPTSEPHEARKGYFYGPRGDVVEIIFQVYGKLAVREGDLILGYVDSIASSPEELKRQRSHVRFGVYIDATPTNRWPSGEVRYIISVPSPLSQTVQDAISHVKTYAPGVSFRAISESEAQTGVSYVRFIPNTLTDAPDCGTYDIGRVASGEQQVLLRDNCTKSQVIHEIGHVLGMQHEHMRCDRDQYVIIHFENLPASEWQQYIIKCSGYSDFAEYNEGSIMHYTAYRKGKLIIESLRGREALMGTATGLARTDVSTLSLMYPAETQVHRWYNPTWASGDHLYTLSATEGTPYGYTLEDLDYFRVTSATGDPSAPDPGYGLLFRCLVNNHHYLSRNAYCEVGIKAEGPVGRVATWQMGGTVPLYRTRNPQNGDRLATTSAAERTATLNAGWINEGDLGYVWPGN
jgi:hypothetical protein